MKITKKIYLYIRLKVLVFLVFCRCIVCFSAGGFLVDLSNKLNHQRMYWALKGQKNDDSVAF